MADTVQSVMDMCQQRISDTSLFIWPSNVIYLDGTSCTKKSTILTMTCYPVSKIQRCSTFIDANSFGPSMMSYVMCGIISQRNDNRARFNDRSPLNVIEWSLLWRFMTRFRRIFGNVRPEFDYNLASEAMREFTRTFDRMFLHLRQMYFYSHFRQQCNALVLIDSNVDRCDMLHRTRGEGSDIARSQWLFYTPLQNRMYTLLYKDACIDLDWFTASTEDTVLGIALYLRTRMMMACTRRYSYRIRFDKRALQRMKVQQYQSQLNDDDNDNDKENEEMEIINPIPMYALRNVDPRNESGDGRDLTLSNMNTHVYRSLGRYFAKHVIPSFSSLTETGMLGMIEDEEENSRFVNESKSIKVRSNDNDKSSGEGSTKSNDDDDDNKSSSSITNNNNDDDVDDDIIGSCQFLRVCVPEGFIITNNKPSFTNEKKEEEEVCSETLFRSQLSWWNGNNETNGVSSCNEETSGPIRTRRARKNTRPRKVIYAPIHRILRTRHMEENNNYEEAKDETTNLPVIPIDESYEFIGEDLAS